MPCNIINADPLCRSGCPSRWCCSFNDKFATPYLLKDEVKRIGDLTGRDDFFMKSGPYCQLKVSVNGYCIFFDTDGSSCGIYNARPFECFIYPFDFYAPTDDFAFWYLWECHFSLSLDDESIEEVLSYLENNFRREILEYWDFDEIVDPKNPKGYRFLRKLNLKKNTGRLSLSK